MHIFMHILFGNYDSSSDFAGGQVQGHFKTTSTFLNKMIYFPFY